MGRSPERENPTQSSRNQDSRGPGNTRRETAREWGRRQAQASPQWSEEKWQRVATLLGIRFMQVRTDGNDDDADAGA